MGTDAAMIHACVAVLTFLAAVGFAQEPVVKIGETTLVGRSIPTLRQEFFGGEYRMHPYLFTFLSIS